MHENFCLVFGCDPAGGVKAQTTMVKDFINHLHEQTDGHNYRVQLPGALQSIEGEDAKFETVTSSKI
jgi:hypothetical protein